MSTWVIIPVKPLNRAKSRLATVLTPEQRHNLAESMFRHVLTEVSAVPQILGTLVISRDAKALSIAREYRARTLQETGTPDLNAALMRATQVILSWGSDSILVLPADLPLVAAEDIANIIQMGRGIPSVVLASDKNQDGTNALFMRPPGVIDFAYGLGSYDRHVALAQAAGVAVKTYYSERLALDIDVSDDLALYRKLDREYQRHDLFISD
jgi:2-phospho-L-lactate/phosphoenolpyruvate guanylyltransferase